MPKERLSMRKIKEVLRLRFEHGLSHRAIATSCGIGITSAREYIVRAKAAGLSWPLSEEMDEGALEGNSGDTILIYASTFLLAAFSGEVGICPTSFRGAR